MSASQILAIVIVAVAAYLFGSLNSAIIVCKITKHDDIRKYGSKNAGLTNVLRVYGKSTAAITLLCDLFKGIFAVTAARIIVGNLFEIYYFGENMFIGYVAGLAVVLGHVFPVYYGFRGGKGVLTACTTMIAIDPLSMSIALLVFIIIVAISRYVSLGSIISGVAYPIATAITQTLRGTDGVLVHTILAIALSALVIAMHHANIVRLIKGTENKLSFKKNQ